ncbi:RDD family protein [Noviherbaspirillum aridicola]|uniref:RDD family membrane protein YckC n=1 Tax=Noviherbaspirillum aridicola TaxID=2849687 RepID=A0ABQ4PZL8_9BURK|nr:RDD family protein [Noviherbaspirillum aridicola]GIZ50261.1 hypothetical protein NCCP691_02750 [Noviherbaspirillum aridicola]
MNGWWYIRDDERVGPVGVDTLQQLYHEGLIDAASMVWQEGMDQWVPLDEVPGLKEAVHAVPPPAPLGRDDEARHALPLAGRWPRFLARAFDLWWASLAVSASLGFLLSRMFAGFVEWMNGPLSAELFMLACLPLALALDAVIYSVLGNTPGKALLGLRVTSVRGELLPLDAYLRRNLRLWMAGLGFGIPPVSLLTMARQSNRLVKGLQASYDEAAGHRVHARAAGIGRRAAFGVLFCVSVASLAGLRYMELERDRQRVEAAAQKFYVWTNPETEQNVIVDARWRLEAQTNDYGTRLFVFSELTGRGQIIFGPEDVPNVDLPDYANAFLQSMRSRMQFNGRGRFFEEDGLPVWEVEGTMPGKKGSVLSVRVIQLDDVFWRLIVVNQPPLDYSAPLADTMKKSLWNSVLPQEPRPTT